MNDLDNAVAQSSAPVAPPARVRSKISLANSFTIEEVSAFLAMHTRVLRSGDKEAADKARSESMLRLVRKFTAMRAKHQRLSAA